MRCKTCGYRLWNLVARRCPECGRPYSPGEFEFTPGTVAYCCPHCGQAYYGTDAKGHLTPQQFDCVSCGRHVSMEEMVLRPTEGVDEDHTEVETVPWLKRSKIGAVRAWLSTIKLALIGQARLMRALPERSPTGSAWWFAILTNLLVQVVIILPGVLLMGFLIPIGPRGGFAGGMGIFFVIVFLLSLLAIVLWGLVTHGLLRLTGPTATTIGRTYQGLCYSSGVNIIASVPCFGFYLMPLGWIWWTVSAVLMTKEGQRVSGGRAALAVITPPAVGFVLFVGGYGLMMWYFISMAGPQPARMRATVQSETTVIARALIAYTVDTNGPWPDHALRLVGDGYIQPENTCSSLSMRSPLDISVGQSDLIEFAELPRDRKAKLMEKLAADLPEVTVAHQFGDFVFTYHGIDSKTADPKLWTVIYWPKSAFSGGMNFTPSLPVGVGLADGSVIVIDRGLFATALDDQNDLRADQGLPPLPPLATVTPGRPAVASP